MSLFESVTKVMKESVQIKKDWDFVVNLNTSDGEVHLSFFGQELSGFLNLANGRKIYYSNRGESVFPYEARFLESGVIYFILLRDGEKEELEELIKEREAEVLANE